jgi:lipid-A-disaccharide synthase-like uncharacterized protein
MFHSVIEFLKNAAAEQIVNDPVWAIVALTGQVVFGGRFVLQWLASEYKKQSYVPTSFWFVSLAGSLILFSYSVHIRNIIFMAGFSLNTFIYLRNLHLIYKSAKKVNVPAVNRTSG